MKVWDNQLFLTQIMKHTQILISAKMNNTGKDLSSETNERLNVYELDAFEPLPQGVLSGNIAQEELPQERYLHNKSINTGLNTIIHYRRTQHYAAMYFYMKTMQNTINATSSYYGGADAIDFRDLRMVETTYTQTHSYTEI